MSSLKNIYFIAICVLIVVLTTRYVVSHIHDTLESKNWQRVSAEVIESAVVEQKNPRLRMRHCAEVKVTFEYNEKTVVSDLKLPDRCDYVFSLINSASDQVAHYPKGMNVEVLVNPEEPTVSSSIEFSQRRPPYFYIFLDIVFMGILIRKLFA